MTIKDVEKLTGLTAKSIRYYEDKGLLVVERNEENDYRSYSEVEVNRLKEIKLLRYLEFSVEEVKGLLDLEVDETIAKLQQKAESFSKESDRCKDKQSLCLTLAKDYKKNSTSRHKMVAEYNEVIDFIESDEMAELEEELLDITVPTMAATIGRTLIGLGPVLWLFLNIHDRMWDMLMLNAVLAVAGTALVTYTWIDYVTQYKKHKERMKKKNRKNIGLFPMILLYFVLAIAVVFVGSQLIDFIFAPDDYLFYEFHPVAGVLLLWMTLIPILLVILLVHSKLVGKTTKEMDNTSDLLFLWNIGRRFRPIVIAIWLVGMYCCITSVNFVAEDEIICHTPLQPMGVTYAYEDVEKITTGFGQSNFAFVEYKKKGNFYYQLELDGRTLVFHQPSVNSDIKRYEEDTYFELEEFDQRLMALGIVKEGDTSGSQNCRLDPYYVERFCRIITNK